MEEILSELQSSELFRNLTHQQLKSVLHCLNANIATYSAGSIIWHIEQTIHTVGLVISGKLSLETYDLWGNKSLVSWVQPGQLFGEAYALSPDTPLSFNVTAHEKSKVLFADINKLLGGCSKHCACHLIILQNLLLTTAGKNRELNQKVNHISRRSIRDKLLSFLSDQSRLQKSSSVILPFNRQELADYLSVDRSALSRELHHMKQDGLLEYTRNVFQLKE